MILKVKDVISESYKDENGNIIPPTVSEKSFEIDSEDFQNLLKNKSEYLKITETGEIKFKYKSLFVFNTEIFPYIQIGKIIQIDDTPFKIIEKTYDQEDHKEAVILELEK